MKKIIGRITFLLVIAALLVSAARALSEGPSAVESEAVVDPNAQSLASDSGNDAGGEPTDPEARIGRVVTALSGRPSPGDPLSDPNHYWAVYVFTRSQGVRDLVAPQGLLGMTLNPGPLYALSDLGFLAWVPEPLIPVLEQHPEVERLEWAAGKMPLVLIQDYEIQMPVSDGSEA